jgi:hypothetical protein
MTLSGYRLGIRLFTLFGLFSLGAILIWVDPKVLRGWGMALFFVCAGVTLTGIVTLFLLYLSEHFVGKEGARHYVGGALRQGALVGGFVVSTLVLLWLKVFSWWIVGLVLVFFLLVEYTYRRLFRTAASS